MKNEIKLKIFTHSLISLIFLAFIVGCDEDDSDSQQVKDGDNNYYETVTIGSQVWMTENLKTTRYNDGTEIALVTDKTNWLSLTTASYCWQNNDMANKNTYGALYNWYTVSSGKLCPKGWHVPSDSDWNTLITNLGGVAMAGGKMKETGTTHWTSPNTGASNESGFTALPGSGRGQYFADANFGQIGNGGYWWSSSEYDANSAWVGFIFYNSEAVSKNTSSKTGGFSVRCIKD